MLESTRVEQAKTIAKESALEVKEEDKILAKKVGKWKESGREEGEKIIANRPLNLHPCNKLFFVKVFGIFLSYSLYLAEELFQDRDTEIQYRFRITFKANE